MGCRVWVLLVLLHLLHSSLPAQAVKVVIPPEGSECLSGPCVSTIQAKDVCPAVRMQIPGGARVDGRVMVSGRSQYYTPFLTVRVSVVRLPSPALAGLRKHESLRSVLTDTVGCRSSRQTERSCGRETGCIRSHILMQKQRGLAHTKSGEEQHLNAEHCSTSFLSSAIHVVMHVHVLPLLPCVSEQVKSKVRTQKVQCH
eukprot:scaffold219149_cov18-Tisochrysis_lutea.AAC.1